MTRRLPPDPEGIAEAASLLRAGELVAIPTETVYGLAADARSATAVARVFEAKGRPHFNPLIVHLPEASAVWREVEPDARARALADSFWPGALTLVLPRSAGCRVDLLAGAGLETLAVRVPAHPVAQALLRSFAGPLAAPSANRSGRVSPTTAQHVEEELGGRIAALLDGGPCRVGVESTVLDLTGPQAVVLRPGGVPIEALRAVIDGVVPPLSHALASRGGVGLRSPGLLLGHYAPSLPLRIDATAVGPSEALLAFGPPLPGAALVEQLSETGDLVEAASRLFAALRHLDAEGTRRGLSGIAAMAVPRDGLGAAIEDRLRRAAQG